MLFLIFVASMILAAAFKKYVKQDSGDAIIASILFVPSLLFFAQDKVLTEISGFGLSGKFAAESRRAVSALAEPVSSLAIAPLSDGNWTFNQAATFEACVEFYVLRPSNVPSRKDDLEGFEDYIANATYAIRSSLACGRLIGVIVLDDRDRYLGSYSANVFAESLSIWAAPDFSGDSKFGELTKADFSNRVLLGTIFGAALQFPEKRINGEGFVAAISDRLSLAEALNEFSRTNAPFLVATNSLGVITGILDYDTTAKTLLAALLRQQDPD